MLNNKAMANCESEPIDKHIEVYRLALTFNSFTSRPDYIEPFPSLHFSATNDRDLLRIETNTRASRSPPASYRRT
ncbi:hypothetical protein C7B77_28055 [Chamaesiphon polymorphus CCALA 037]|uniref:Uncharacterized protein n=1 Tax=Chamaesiphon polymorphus CCALA 037 TaxID=2107692 RepID=A0A2T1F6U3_9CYAN|nr:hypothetical protein C7B77_28055 [Chamaesiphon polymorphus CCALA 037]